MRPSALATTVPQLILRAARRQGIAARHYRDGAWRELSYAELGRTVQATAGGLIELGVQPGERVAILASTRPEWLYADFGALCAGAVVVPVYHANSPEECEYVLAHSGARVVICEDRDQLWKIEQIRSRLPRLAHVVAFEDAPGDVLSLAALQSAGLQRLAEVEARAQAVETGDVCTIPYTSGTTGPPKGCLITHGNCLANCRMGAEVTELGTGSSVFLFLPLAHALTRAAVIYAIDQGAQMIFWRGDIRAVLDDIAETRPTHLMSAPQLFEKVYTAANAAALESGALRRLLFEWAVACGTKARRATAERGELPPLLRLRLRLADRLVLSRVRGLFGGRLQLALSGAAPIAAEILEFFAACGVVVLEGYGMTEGTAMTTCNRPGEIRFGTVGPPVAPAQVSIADDGEVLVRGPHVFGGYYHDDLATRSTLVGGWLHTGDLGMVDSRGFLTITGRKKEILITSAGKNVAPANIESMLRESRWISHAVVFGDRRPHLVALLWLDPDELAALAARTGGGDPRVESLATSPAVNTELAGMVAAVNKRLARAEQVRRFAIVPGALSLEGGELTPTMKLKRAVVHERYGHLADELYEDGAPAAGAASAGSSIQLGSYAPRR
jgi:long-chain acyl-CoA synthetase